MTSVDAVNERGSHGHLLRVLGMAFALAVGIGATIGGGILRTPGEIAALLPDAGWIMAAWLFGGINALLGATVYSELGAMMPRSGGMYVFAQRALGDYAGFFVGYTNWLADCAAIAALALIVGDYSGVLLPVLAGHSIAVAFAVLAILVAMQVHGVRWGGRLQIATTLAKTLALGGLVIAAFALPHPVSNPPAAAIAPPHGTALLAALAIAMQSVIFTYNGYFYAIFFGEELHDPGTQIPRAMFRGLLLIIAVYLSLNAAFLWVLPIARMAHEPFVGGVVAQALFGQRGDAIIRGIVIVSVLGTVNALLLAAPRILLAMGRDRLFAPQATRVNAGGTPLAGLLFSTAVGCAFLLSGTFTAVLAIAAMFIVMNYLMMYLSLLALRRNAPQTPRPYRAWGYPWTTWLGLLAAISFMAGVALSDTRHATIALLILLASYPLYRGTRRLLRVAE
jgi:APA family basic amino acid/polyamine antiporter